MEEVGVCWPLTDGKVSTTVTAKEVLAAATGPETAAAIALRKEQQWREQYVRHFVAHVAASAASAEAALKAASTGLEEVYNRFRFLRPAAASPPGAAAAPTGGSGGAAPLLLRDAMASPVPDMFRTVEIVGSGGRGGDTGGGGAGVGVPYRGAVLRGAALVRQADEWARRGVIEPSAASAVRAVVEGGVGGAADLASHAFVVMGAGAEMGPTKSLLEAGATVVALDLDGRPAVWHRLLAMVRASPGRLVVPVRRTKDSGAHGGSAGGGGGVDGDDAALCNAAGCNLLTDTPEVADWLCGVCAGRSLTVGGYAYMDGASFVRISVAQDAIAAEVCRRRPGTSLAYLCTPTDVFVRPMEARAASLRGYADRPLWTRAINVATGGKMCAQNLALPAPVTSAEGVPLDVVDCCITQQGPNYLLAKRIQHWRALVARAAGTRVSSNVAPASATVSVTKAKVLKAAYDGVALFPPIEIFEPGTANAAMTVALLHDVFTASAGAAANPAAALPHPLLLFADNAWHGGMWRAGVHIASSAVVAAVYGLAAEYRVPLASGGALAACAVVWLVRHGHAGAGAAPHAAKL